MSAQSRLEKLDERERRLLTILIGMVGAALFLALPVGLYSVVSGKRRQNEDIRELLTNIYDSQGAIGERKAKQEALLSRYAKPAPALAGFIDEAAKSNGISAAESSDRPDVPHGKRYTEKVAVVKMHKVGMLALLKTLERIEQSGHPVSISKLNIRPRTNEPDSYEVELGISAYERKGDAPPPPSEGAEPEAGSQGRTP